jgi:primosomal protein N' (replication factor Y) (superfamily II helicase)
MSDEQRNLFEMSSEPWDDDDQAEEAVATVVFPTGPGQTFDYTVPDRLRGEVEAGRRVRVPLGRGNRLVVGYCVEVETRRVGPRRLKNVAEVVDRRPLLSPAMIRLTSWIADYYLCDLGLVLESVLPAGVRDQAGTRLTTVLRAAEGAAAQLTAGDLPKKQLEVLKVLAAAARPLTMQELARAAGTAAGPITALRRKGLIRSETTRLQVERSPAPPPKAERNFELNDDQRNALDTILAALNARRHETILVHGVTGSGKTEVYIQAIQEIVRFGRQAIVLVPEISLTPQTVGRFRARFGEVAVLHSHLGDAQRHWHWQQIASGKVSVVVGARSAIFAPTPHLGLIVLDEEHENSFKQEIAPRYHARDVALARAEAEGVPLVLGSATPSLESYYRARNGQYTLVEMPRRVLDRPLPRVATVDLRGDVLRPSRGAVGRHLQQAMKTALDAGGQVILLLNRRGFSTHIQCPACGTVVRCPDCDIALTHHRTLELAICHYCDYQIAAPTECPNCRFAGIRYHGIGTQRLEAEVRARFPDVACFRMDTDTMRGVGSHERALADFRAGRTRILLGTQMIAKGLDFPDVTLVGVINADTALHLPDFRAAERTFQLVTQVAGRTGRGPKGGRVLVQTYNPEHPAIRAAVRHDYVGFATNELPMREMLQYPPYASMVRLVIRGPVEKATEEFAKGLATRLQAELAAREADAKLLGPAPAPFARLKGRYRFQVQVQAADGQRLREAVRQLLVDIPAGDDIQWIADVDPVEML